MTSFWPTVTQSPDCIATMSIQLQWQWRTGFRETIAYLSLADIANLGAIRLSLISAHGTVVSFLLPHGQIRHNINLESTLGTNLVTLLALLCGNIQHFSPVIHCAIHTLSYWLVYWLFFFCITHLEIYMVICCSCKIANTKHKKYPRLGAYRPAVTKSMKANVFM